MRPTTARQTDLSDRLCLGGRGAGKPISSSAFNVACSLPASAGIQKEEYARDAHGANEKQEVSLLKSQCVAEGCLAREFCFEIPDLGGQPSTLCFESLSLRLKIFR